MRARVNSTPAAVAGILIIAFGRETSAQSRRAASRVLSTSLASSGATSRLTKPSAPRVRANTGASNLLTQPPCQPAEPSASRLLAEVRELLGYTLAIRGRERSDLDVPRPVGTYVGGRAVHADNHLAAPAARPLRSRKRSVLASLWTSHGETPTVRQSRRRLAGGVTDLGEGWKIWDEEFVAGVLRVTAQPLWVVDPEGLIRFANPAAIEALGIRQCRRTAGTPQP